MKRHDIAFCAFCLMGGIVLPWALLLAGAAMSILNLSPYWNETAAWLVALGVSVLCASYFFRRFLNSLREHSS